MKAVIKYGKWVVKLIYKYFESNFKWREEELDT